MRNLFLVLAFSFTFVIVGPEFNSTIFAGVIVDETGDGTDGDDGVAGVDGDPATDGEDGGDGGDGILVNPSYVQAGNGGRGGAGGNGIDGRDADQDAASGNGGNGGDGGHACLERILNEAMAEFESFATARGGDGGFAGLAGTSVGNAGPALNGNGGNGGNATAIGDVANTSGSVEFSARADGGRGAGTFASQGGVSQSGNGGFADASSTVTSDNASVGVIASDAEAFGGDGGSVSGNGSVASGNGGRGGDAMASSILNVTNSTGITNASSYARAIAGDGGSGLGVNGQGNNGGTASATATVMSTTDNASAEAEARGGSGGNGSSNANGGNGADVTMINAVSGGAAQRLSLTQFALAGSGGNRFVGTGNGGLAGNAISTLVLDNDANQLGDDVRATVDSRAGVGGTGFNMGNDGGSATLEIDIRDVGEVFVNGFIGSGNGGDAIQGGAAGDGGQLNVDRVYGESVADDVTMRLTAHGGSGGDAFDSNQAGNGTSVILNNVVDGNSTGDVFLFQEAQAGGAGASTSGQMGIAGSAVSTIDVVKSSADLEVFTRANGGGGGDANNGAATSQAIAKNLVGDSEAGATAEAGAGSANATSLARATAVASGTTALSSAESKADFLNLGDFHGTYSSTAESIHEGSGTATATSRSTASNVDTINASTALVSDAIAIVNGLGVANARAVATGTVGTSSVTGSAYAESRTDAIARVEFVGGQGIDGTATTQATDGTDLIFDGGVASGKAGTELELEYKFRAGTGGDAGDGTRAGLGGDARLSINSTDVNTGGGKAVISPKELFGGRGGDGNSAAVGGNGGDAILNINIVDSDEVRVAGEIFGSDIVSGGGGGSELGGGNSGMAVANVYLESTSASDLAVDLIENQFDAGNGFNGADGGHASMSTGDITLISNGGNVSAFNAAIGGRGGATTLGRTGDGGDAFSVVRATTNGFGTASAASRATGGWAGFTSSGTFGDNGTSQSTAIATTSNIGLLGTGKALARSEVVGEFGEAVAIARTGNGKYRNVSVTATSISNSRSGISESLATTRIGGLVFTDSQFDFSQAAGVMLFDPDISSVLNDVQGSGSDLNGNDDVLALFNLGQDTTAPLSDVFVVGEFGAEYMDNEVGLQSIHTVEMVADIDLRGMNDRELAMGFYGVDDSSVNFDSLSLSVELEGFQDFGVTFDSVAEANAFFDDNTMVFGDLWGMQELEARILMTFTSSAANANYQFKFVLGNAGVNSVPEPSTLGLIGVVLLFGMSRRRRHVGNYGETINPKRSFESP